MIRQGRNQYSPHAHHSHELWFRGDWFWMGIRFHFQNFHFFMLLMAWMWIFTCVVLYGWWNISDSLLDRKFYEINLSFCMWPLYSFLMPFIFSFCLDKCVISFFLCQIIRFLEFQCRQIFSLPVMYTDYACFHCTNFLKFLRCISFIDLFCIFFICNIMIFPCSYSV